jgi:hypothetical protein
LVTPIRVLKQIEAVQGVSEFVRERLFSNFFRGIFMSRQAITRWLRVGPVFSLLTAFAFGCSGGGSSEISGTVTYKGSPLTGGSIVFRADDGKEYGSGLDKDGKYYVNKVPRGNMKVYFNMPLANAGNPRGVGVPKEHEAEMKQKMKPPPGAGPDAEKAYAGVGQNQKTPEIPARYKSFENSGLSFDIKSGSNKIDIPLSD